MIEALERAVATWLERRRCKRMAHRFGGIQQCPWCRQYAQDGDGWHFELGNDGNDILHCGVCKGMSRWRFEMGMIYLGPVSGPIIDMEECLEDLDG